MFPSTLWCIPAPGSSVLHLRISALQFELHCLALYCVWTSHLSITSRDKCVAISFHCNAFSTVLPVNLHCVHFFEFHALQIAIPVTVDYFVFVFVFVYEIQIHNTQNCDRDGIMQHMQCKPFCHPDHSWVNANASGGHIRAGVLCICICICIFI